MVYIEGDASMRKFTTPEGGEKQALSIVQREFHYCPVVVPEDSLDR